MRFEEACIKLFDREYLMAYRKGWPDIVTTIRATEDKNGNQVIVYYHLNQAQIPVVLTKETVENDDWVCTNELEERFCIKNFMMMPKAKEFLKAVDDFLNSNNKVLPPDFQSNEYKLRMNEAVPLRLMHADFKNGKLMLTDIGYDLVKMCV